MYAVVNHLPIKDGADWGEMAAKFGAFAASTRKVEPSLLSASMIRVGEIVAGSGVATGT